jgi:hypothetical protein
MFLTIGPSMLHLSTANIFVSCLFIDIFGICKGMACRMKQIGKMSHSIHCRKSRIYIVCNCMHMACIDCLPLLAWCTDTYRMFKWRSKFMNFAVGSTG